MTEHNQPEECEIGENLAADISLIGCYLMQEGVVREKKEKIKEYVAQVVTAHLKNQKHSPLSTIKSEVEGMKIEEKKTDSKRLGFEKKARNHALQQVINLIEKHQNEG